LNIVTNYLLGFDETMDRAALPDQAWCAAMMDSASRGQRVIATRASARSPVGISGSRERLRTNG
jgi:hypothetical protein